MRRISPGGNMPWDRSRTSQGRSTEVWAKRAKNALALLAIGDGVMQIVAPQEHERLWMVGPAWVSKAKGIGWLSENPRYTPAGSGAGGRSCMVRLETVREHMTLDRQGYAFGVPRARNR